MIEFVDKTSEQNGTPINRENMMAVQGFITNNIVFDGDKSFVKTNKNNEKLTTIFNDDGSVAETFVGQKNITKTTKFINGSIVEEIL